MVSSMTKLPYAFDMQNYQIQQTALQSLHHCLVLSQPEGFDLSRFFPKQWRGKSCKVAQHCLPNLCPDPVLIATSQRNAECRQLTFVQNFMNQSADFQKNQKNAQEYVQTLRKHIPISTLSNLLLAHFDFYTIQCEDMKIFSRAKEKNLSLENALMEKDGSMELEIGLSRGNFLSPYETNLLGFLAVPLENTHKITERVLEKEFEYLNLYHRRNCIYSTKHF